jgi:glyoxylase-like metal-dependent hydrolase (beta-lactamase superfamily II)
VRPIDVRHQGTERVICAWYVDGVVIDPGPESAVESLLEGLGGERPEALLLTHIHFDHAGASGALVRRWPDLPVYVHERGARHLADPAKLVSSAARLYGGEDGLRKLWGEVVPVPEENLHVLEGGETVRGFSVEYTPGHASHHVCYLHMGSGWAFVGDVAGVRVPPSELVVAPTPPPDIDLDAWDRSLDLVADWEPSGLGLTHFGAVEDDVEHHLDAMRRALHEQADIAARTDMEGFIAAMKERTSGEDPALSIAAPFDHLFLGLDRWHRVTSNA